MILNDVLGNFLILEKYFLLVFNWFILFELIRGVNSFLFWYLVKYVYGNILFWFLDLYDLKCVYSKCVCFVLGVVNYCYC